MDPYVAQHVDSDEVFGPFDDEEQAKRWAEQFGSLKGWTFKQITPPTFHS